MENKNTFEDFKKLHKRELFVYENCKYPYVYSKVNNVLTVIISLQYEPMEMLYEFILLTEKYTSVLLIDYADNTKSIEQYGNAVIELIKKLGYNKAIFMCLGYSDYILNYIYKKYNKYIYRAIYVNPYMMEKIKKSHLFLAYINSFIALKQALVNSLKLPIKDGEDSQYVTAINNLLDDTAELWNRKKWRAITKILNNTTKEIDNYNLQKDKRLYFIFYNTKLKNKDTLKNKRLEIIQYNSSNRAKNMTNTLKKISSYYEKDLNLSKVTKTQQEKKGPYSKTVYKNNDRVIVYTLVAIFCVIVTAYWVYVGFINMKDTQYESGISARDNKILTNSLIKANLIDKYPGLYYEVNNVTETQSQNKIIKEYHCEVEYKNKSFKSTIVIELDNKENDTGKIVKYLIDSK